MQPSPAPIRCEDHGPARVLIIDRPAALNALDETLLDALLAAVDEAGAASDVRGVILTGAGGKAFAAGADISAMTSMSTAEALRFSERGHALGERLASLPKVTIAAVDGFALGGGCELALACDFVYASTRAVFGQPEVRLGVIPGFGGTQRLLRRIGLARALELCVTGERIDANEALRLGLANRVVESADLLGQAIATIETVAKMGPLAIQKVKSVMYAGANVDLATGNRLEREAFAALFGTEDQREGMAAFLEKRSPRFQGR